MAAIFNKLFPFLINGFLKTKNVINKMKMYYYNYLCNPLYVPFYVQYYILYNTNFSRGGNFRYIREFGFCAKFSSRENNIHCEWDFAKFSPRENKILIAV